MSLLKCPAPARHRRSAVRIPADQLILALEHPSTMTCQPDSLVSRATFRPWRSGRLPACGLAPVAYAICQSAGMPSSFCKRMSALPSPLKSAANLLSAYVVLAVGPSVTCTLCADYAHRNCFRGLRAYPPDPPTRAVYARIPCEFFECSFLYSADCANLLRMQVILVLARALARITRIVTGCNSVLGAARPITCVSAEYKRNWQTQPLSRIPRMLTKCTRSDHARIPCGFFECSFPELTDCANLVSVQASTRVRTGRRRLCQPCCATRPPPGDRRPKSARSSVATRPAVTAGVGKSPINALI
jgi:hypothetical protein